MFSKLRPHHRRSGSTPTSPSPNQIPAGFLPLPPSSSHGPVSATTPSSAESPSPFFFSRVPESNNGLSVASNADSPISPVPPLLPPIPRVASVYEREEEYGRPQGLALQVDELLRVRSNDSEESKSSSPILSGDFREDQTFSFKRPGHESRTSQEAGDEKYSRSGKRPSTSNGESGYRNTMMSAQVRRDGVSESQFRSILQGKHLPPLPNNGSPSLRPHDMASLPPVLIPDEPHQYPTRPPPMSLNTQSTTRHGSAQSMQSRNERGGKTKLHLLNPMSLLMRRRNVPMLDQLSEEALMTQRNTSVSPLPDDYDPSIRGKVVHDFNAPRPRQNFSKQTVMEAGERERHESFSREGRDTVRKGSEDTVRYERQSQHTPVFKEHFEDDVDQKASDSAIRAENLANKDFIARHSFPLPDTDALSSLPPFARVAKTVYKPPEQTVASPPAPPVPEKDINENQPQPQPAPLSPLMEDPVSPNEEITPKRASNVRQSVKSSTRTPPSTRSSRISRTSLGPDFQPNGLPAHMLSRSSRFSFQYANTDSAAQERMMEEKHREKQAKALAERSDEPENDHIEEEDDFDYDDMDDYGGMEDDVPMNGEDWDYGGGLGIGVNNMTIDSMSSGMGGLSNMTLGSLSTSTSDQTLHIPPYDPLKINPTESSPIASHDVAAQGLGIQASALNGNELVKGSDNLQPFKPKFSANDTLKQSTVDSFVEQDDDFYFDNGEFDDDVKAEFDHSSAFDEAVFDDPNHALYERKPPQAPPIPEQHEAQPTATNTLKREQAGIRGPSEPGPEHPDPTARLDTVNAYHSALAEAATKAAAAGRFERANSAIDNGSELSPVTYHGGSIEGHGEENRPDLVFDDARLSQESSTLSPPTARTSGIQEDELPMNKSVDFVFPGAYSEDNYTSDFDYSDYDSAMEDDAYIAAANAEALENDEEGVYGSEFGFYAKPGTTDNDAGGSAFGGYFGPKDWGEIKRQRSTREPNLTPITERSEYSTRNSFVGLGFAEHERGHPSPGLAALARMSPGWESDMNMETLMKLRRGVWGGSEGSLSKGSPSGAGSSPMNSSPIAGKSDPRALWSSPMSRQIGEIPGYNETDADDEEEDYEGLLDEANYDEDGQWTHDSEEGEEYADDVSPVDEDEDDGDSPINDSPTIRAQMSSSVSPMKLGPPFAFPLSSPTATAPAGTAQTSQRNSHSPISPVKGGHSRSGSDTVAYVRERDDEKGEFRWVLERRRTGEDGVESLIGRTLVEGGRI